jgi:peptidoglycan/LPS O-acetylase OafA/YrhL
VSSSGSFFPCCCNCTPPSTNDYGTVTASTQLVAWNKVATKQAIILLTITLIVFGADWAQRAGTGGGGILGAVWLQAIICFTQLDFIVTITQCEGESLSSIVLRHPWVQWLGELSMCIYLIHVPVLYYICWAIKGSSASYPHEMDCSKYDKDTTEYNNCDQEVSDFQDARELKIWAVPIVMVISVILAAVLYYGIEKPCREAWKVK